MNKNQAHKKKSFVGWIHNEDWEFLGKVDRSFTDCGGIYYIPNLIKGKPKFCDNKVPCKVRIIIEEI